MLNDATNLDNTVEDAINTYEKAKNTHSCEKQAKKSFREFCKKYFGKNFNAIAKQKVTLKMTLWSFPSLSDWRGNSQTKYNRVFYKSNLGSKIMQL